MRHRYLDTFAEHVAVGAICARRPGLDGVQYGDFVWIRAFIAPSRAKSAFFNGNCNKDDTQSPSAKSPLQS
jgi:hypothetical protein